MFDWEDGGVIVIHAVIGVRPSTTQPEKTWLVDLVGGSCIGVSPEEAKRLIEAMRKIYEPMVLMSQGRQEI